MKFEATQDFKISVFLGKHKNKKYDLKKNDIIEEVDENLINKLKTIKQLKQIK